MANKKTTKRALLFSLLSMLLCVTMLMGTTFAWFTDSVSSVNNIIKSGNLDIELEYWNGSAWVDVSGKSDVLTNELFEPGVTEIAYLRVANAGSLALKYQLGINIVSEKAGKNVAGKEFKLSDYIQFGVVEGVNGETGAYANREAAVAAVTDAKKISAGYTKAASMTAGEELYLALVVYMPTTVDNVANHDGENVPQIDLGINVVATQFEYENDSFGNDYDAGLEPTVSYVATYDALVEALNQGGKVELQSDIVVPAAEMNTTAASVPTALAITGGQNVVLDLAGHSITAESDDTAALLFVHNSTVTITGEGDLNLNADGFVVWAKGNSTVNVESGNLNGGKAETSVFYASSNAAYDPASGYATINVYGGNFDSVSKTNPADKLNIANVMNHGAGRINYYGGTFGWDPSSSEFVHVDDKNYVKVAEGYKVTEVGGVYVVTANTFNVVTDADGLVEALENGKDVVLYDDVKIDPANMSNAYGTTGINVKNGQTIDGNGNVLDIKGAGGTWDSGISTTGGLIKNITITGSFRGIFINHNSDYSEKVILENVTIDGTVYTISCDQGLNQGLEAANSTFKGWTSYAATLGDAKFVDCSFGKGSGYAYCRPYAPTEFVGCDFEEGYKVNPVAAVTFENCTIGGKPLTAENLATLISGDIAKATVK